MNKLEKFVFPHAIYYTTDKETARLYLRKDCPYCVSNWKLGKRVSGWIVNTETRDIVGAFK